MSHIVGFILLGGGLLAVFVSELRAWRTRDIHIFAEAAWYTATFYDSLVLPGAIIVGLSGLLLTFELGLGFFAEPWLVGMWGLFLFELVEGNSVTRVQFRRTLRRLRSALESGELTNEHREEARTLLGQVTHFLDVPLFLVIVYCGAMRPWRHVLLATVALSDDHFNYRPDHITWAHVGTLEHYAELLKRISDSAFREGEHAN